MISLFSNADSLILTKCSKFSSFRAIPFSFVREKAIHSLNFSGLIYLQDRDLHVIFQHCSRIQVLDISGTGITDAGLEYISFYDERHKALEVLKLGKCTELSNHGLGYVLYRCSELRYLDLRETFVTSALFDSNPWHSDMKLKVFILTQCKRLSNLNLQLTYLERLIASNLLVKSIELTTPNLALLNLSQSKHLTRLSGAMPCLKSIMLSGCQSLSDCVGDFGNSLESCNLYNCRKLSRQSFDLFMRSHVCLQSFVLKGLIQLTDEWVRNLPDEFPQLTECDISGCKGLSGNVVARVLSLNR